MGIRDRLARRRVSGVDIWLNTPTRPLEASGTSGEKALLNGVVNFSVLDGWWLEGYREGDVYKRQCEGLLQPATGHRCQPRYHRDARCGMESVRQVFPSGRGAYQERACGPVLAESKLNKCTIRRFTVYEDVYKRQVKELGKLTL